MSGGAPGATDASDGDPDAPDPVVTVGAIDGAVLLLAAGKARLDPERLPDLVERAAAHLRDRRTAYRRRYERVLTDDTREIYFADRDHGTGLGDELDLDGPEVDAVRIAHEEQLRHLGRAADREEEFDHALEIRDPVVVGRPGDAAAPGDG